MGDCLQSGLHAPESRCARHGAASPPFAGPCPGGQPFVNHRLAAAAMTRGRTATDPAAPSAGGRSAALTAPSLAALSTCACPCRPRDLSRCRTPFHPLRPCAPPSHHGPRLGALAHRPAAAARPRLSGGQRGRHAQPVWALSAHKRGAQPSLHSAAAPLAGGPARPTRHRHGESSKAGRVARRREHPELGGVEQRGREGPVEGVPGEVEVL